MQESFGNLAQPAAQHLGPARARRSRRSQSNRSGVVMTARASVGHVLPRAAAEAQQRDPDAERNARDRPGACVARRTSRRHCPRFDIGQRSVLDRRHRWLKAITLDVVLRAGCGSPERLGTGPVSRGLRGLAQRTAAQRQTGRVHGGWWEIWSGGGGRSSAHRRARRLPGTIHSIR